MDFAFQEPTESSEAEPIEFRFSSSRKDFGVLSTPVYMQSVISAESTRIAKEIKRGEHYELEVEIFGHTFSMVLVSTSHKHAAKIVSKARNLILIIDDAFNVYPIAERAILSYRKKPSDPVYLLVDYETMTLKDSIYGFASKYSLVPFEERNVVTALWNAVFAAELEK